MKTKKTSSVKIILLLVFLGLIQLFGYVAPGPRLLIPGIPNEATAIAQARARLRALEIPTAEYVFTGEFSWRSRTWAVTVSPMHNISETTHYFEFFAITGWSVRENVNWDLVPPWPH